MDPPSQPPQAGDAPAEQKPDVARPGSVSAQSHDSQTAAE